MEVSLRCHNSPRRYWVTRCAWRHAPEARGSLCENLKKIRVGFWTPNEKDRFLELAGARRTCARWGPLDLGAKWIRQHRDCVFTSYVETFNSKLMKRFRTWTRSSYVFLRFLFFIYSIVMNITCLFRTWPYSCIWLRNKDNCSKVLNINTHQGLYNLNRLPFRFKVTPSLFQQVIDTMLTG